MTEFSGFLNIDKPLGLTSHDVVARARRALKLKKIGHAGTLDPLATGVLVLCVGTATRLSEYVMHQTKRYRAQVYLGVETETYDAEGAVTATRDASAITREVVERALADFTGDIDQIPPMYSAIKQEGRKLYDLARTGQTVERAARRVRIDSLTIIAWEPPLFTLDVVCGAGTYIRSLAHDLGAVLGVGAHLAGLRREASGGFTLAEAVALEALLADPDPLRHLIAPGRALADWPAVHLSAYEADAVSHGRAIPAEGAAGLAAAYGPDGVFLAILQGDSDQ